MDYTAGYQPALNWKSGSLGFTLVYLFSLSACILASMEIKTATIDDLGLILALQKLAYRSEAAIYEDYTIPPLIQTREEIEADFRKQVYLKAIPNGGIPAAST